MVCAHSRAIRIHCILKSTAERLHHLEAIHPPREDIDPDDIVDSLQEDGEIIPTVYSSSSNRIQKSKEALSLGHSQAVDINTSDNTLLSFQDAAKETASSSSSKSTESESLEVGVSSKRFIATPLRLESKRARMSTRPPTVFTLPPEYIPAQLSIKAVVARLAKEKSMAMSTKDNVPITVSGEVSSVKMNNSKFSLQDLLKKKDDNEISTAYAAGQAKAMQDLHQATYDSLAILSKICDTAADKKQFQKLVDTLTEVFETKNVD